MGSLVGCCRPEIHTRNHQEAWHSGYTYAMVKKDTATNNLFCNASFSFDFPEYNLLIINKYYRQINLDKESQIIKRKSI